MQLEAEFVVKIEAMLHPTAHVGKSAAGHLAIIPIAGGSFTGPKLRGSVCAGGADWNEQLSGTVAHVHAQYWLQTDDGVIISVTNEGFLDLNNPEARIQTTPRFTVDENSAYAFMNVGVFTAELQPGQTPDSVEITVYKMK